MIGKVEHRIRNLIVLTMAVILIQSGEAYAVEDTDLSMENHKQEVVSVIMPTVDEDEESPFDFIVDPQGLIFDTDAMLYGGGTVEEDAHLLFHNREEAEYDFSSCSDHLTVTNCSTVPVMITITAKINDIENITLASEPDFSDNRECSIYLALVDDKGQEQPLSDENEVSVSSEIYMTPENDTYSFGLKGECNVNGRWENTAIAPKVTITWHAEPIFSEENTENKPNLSEEDKNVNTDEMEEIEKEPDTEDYIPQDGNMEDAMHIEEKETEINENSTDTDNDGDIDEIKD